MTLELVAGLIALAALDSLNPFLIAAQIYLLGTERPQRRAWAFLVASFVTYLVAGIVLVQGAWAFVRSLLPLLSAAVLDTLRIVLGLVGIAAAIWLWRRRKRGVAFVPPQRIGVGATIAFAAASTISDLPTALPYLAAVAQIAAPSFTFAQEVALLLLYDLVYIAPLLAIMAAYYRSTRREIVFGRITSVINRAFAALLAPSVLVGALAVLVPAVLGILGSTGAGR